MIFRLDGTVETTLALTPIIREWKEVGGSRVIVDVNYPELFEGNPYVDGMADYSGKSDDAIVNLNYVNWRKDIRPVCESFAEGIFGRTRLANWRTEMYGADSLPVDGNAVALCLKEPIPGLEEGLVKMGLSVRGLSGLVRGGWRAFRANVARCGLYVGDDGDETAVALTTDVPAVVCYTWRNPVYFAPFRRSVPFEAIVPDKNEFSCAGYCFSSNGLFELGKIYGVRCSRADRLACARARTAERVMQAVERIRAHA